MSREQIVKALLDRGYKEAPFRKPLKTDVPEAPDVFLAAFVAEDEDVTSKQRPVLVVQLGGKMYARIFVVLDSLAELDEILNWERDR